MQMTTRFTVTLPTRRYAALKETAARQGKTLAEIVDESLDLYGVNTKASALELLAKARRKAYSTETKAVRLAIKEVRAHRGR